MSDTAAALRRRIGRARDLQSVVRTMKALASVGIVQSERAVDALRAYARTVELGITAALRAMDPAVAWQVVRAEREVRGGMGLVVFGSDQGLVGQFNDRVATRAVEALAEASQASPAAQAAVVWAVGERVRDRLMDLRVPVHGTLAVPGSVHGITPLAARILLDSEALRRDGRIASLALCWCRPGDATTVVPVVRQLLPLDDRWYRTLRHQPWPTVALPDVPGAPAAALRLLVRELLFVRLHRAAAESMAAEQASRLEAMQRAERNIEELAAAYTATYHRVRQAGIDAELFDVVAGAEASGAAPGV